MRKQEVETTSPPSYLRTEHSTTSKSGVLPRPHSPLKMVAELRVSRGQPDVRSQEKLEACVERVPMCNDNNRLAQTRLDLSERVDHLISRP